MHKENDNWWKEKWNDYKGIITFFPLISLFIGFLIFFNSTDKNQSEADNKTLGFQKWQYNVLKDTSPNAKELRDSINPDNPTYVMYDFLNAIQINGVKILKDLEAAIKLDSRIPTYMKKPITYTIDKSVNEAKDIYYIKFIDDNGNTIKDENGREMIYKDGQKIILPMSDKPYKYVFMRGKYVIPFVYNSNSSTGKFFDITTIPITYTDDETITKTLYSNIYTLKIGKNKLNIIYGNSRVLTEEFKYHFIFDLTITNPNKKSNIIWVIVGVILLSFTILAILHREKIKYLWDEFILKIRYGR